MYKLTNSQVIFRKSDGAFIPSDNLNRDFIEYKEWLALENTPEPADPLPSQDINMLRQQAYREESDPLFFKAQRGEVTMDAWKEKIEEIRARFPDGVMPVFKSA
jgi:hypothetical protein